MNISNVTEFATFVSNNNLMGLDSSLAQIVQCMNSYNAACNCWKREDKQKLYNTCNQVYFHCAKNVVPRLKDEFLSKTSERQISFSNDQGQAITIISR